jgi:hypothetical protein
MMSKVAEIFPIFSNFPQNNAGKAAFRPHSLRREKTCLQGQDKRLKKISTLRYASGSIFLAALASTAATLRRCAPAHAATLHLVLTAGVAACFSR